MNLAARSYGRMEEAGSIIYVIGEDAAAREDIGGMLQSAGLRAEYFASTADFLKAARPKIAGCLIVDVKLSGSTMQEFQEPIRKAEPEIPVIFIAARSDLDSAPQDIKTRAVELLARPFQKETLLDAVKRALDRDRRRRENPNKEEIDIDLVKKVASRVSAAIPMGEVLGEVVEFVTSVVKCDSCLVYVLESDELVLRASKNPHPELVDRLKLELGQGITGWVAEHLEPVAVARNAFEDPRFKLFNELPEDRFEAFLSVPMVSGGKLVGVINVQNRAEHQFSRREISLIATVGYLVGAEVERARLESENSELSERLETRKLIERAKGILQRDLKVSEEEAYRALQRESQQRRKPMKDMAEAIILSDDLKRHSQ